MDSPDLAWNLFKISTTGFFFLIGCLWFILKQLPDGKKMSQDLSDIKDALLGTMTRPGYISKLYTVGKDVDDLKVKVIELEKQVHGGSKNV